MLLKKIKNSFLIFIIIFSFSHQINLSNANEHIKKNIDNVYNLLKEKKFQKAIELLSNLSNENNSKAQYLFSQILYSGKITPQDFKRAYFWSNLSNLGGYKKSSVISDLLEDTLDEKIKIEINIEIQQFLEKLSKTKNKLAILQLAKWYLELSEEIDYINAYKWYNVAVAIGIKSATKKRDEIIKKLTSAEILEAQKSSYEIFNKIEQIGE